MAFCSDFLAYFPEQKEKGPAPGGPFFGIEWIYFFFLGGSAV
jgi:hypothetical protein